MQTYRIVDEPSPGVLSDWVVNPVFPLLALMLGGAWVGLPWFVFNSWALGSSTRWRELVLVVVCAAGSLALLVGLSLALETLGLPKSMGRYAALVITLWKLGVGYWLHTLQDRSFALHRYFEGRTRNGVLVLVAAALLRAKVLGVMTEGPWWVLLA